MYRVQKPWKLALFLRISLASSILDIKVIFFLPFSILSHSSSLSFFPPHFLFIDSFKQWSQTQFQQIKDIHSVKELMFQRPSKKSTRRNTNCLVIIIDICSYSYLKFTIKLNTPIFQFGAPRCKHYCTHDYLLQHDRKCGDQIKSRKLELWTLNKEQICVIMVSSSRNSGSLWKIDGSEDALIFQIKSTDILSTLTKQHTV